jgi:hypothetical protein
MKRGEGSTNLIAVVLLIGLVLFVLFYGLPMMRGGTGGSPQINAPGSVNVNPQ